LRFIAFLAKGTNIAANNTMEPLQPCYKELENFINPGEELVKKDLVELLASKVSYYLITTLKLFQFYKIGRKQSGEFYIL
jgi:hypothetical protein